MAAKKKAKKKIVNKKAKKKTGKKKATKKKAVKKKSSKKKAKKRIGGKNSKATERTEKEKQNAMHGNSFWMARSTHGRNPTFKNANDLWDACVQYFIWVEDNPLTEKKLFSFQGFVHSGQIDKIRAMTIGGLCIFLDICRNTWTNYKSKEGKTDKEKKLAEDFLRVTSKVEEIIKSQKFEGAAADLLNANIIARDLGLKDKQDLSSEDGSMSPSESTLTKDQALELLKKNDMAS